ncbi:MAG: OB-fold nucleic acid binding domain-containing protein, partial [Segatella oris]
MCNTHCVERDKKEELAKKEEISIGGIVTGVKSKFTKNGKPCGFVTLEDFEGSGELAFFGEEWGRWRGMLTEGCIVYITAKCQQRYRDSNFYDLRVQDIQYMQTVKDTRLEKITISVDSTVLTEAVVNDLSTLVEKTPGKAQLYVQVIDREHNVSVMLRSRSHTVDVTKELLNYVDSNSAMSYHIN